jgi:hypothetical protein
VSGKPVTAQSAYLLTFLVTAASLCALPVRALQLVGNRSEGSDRIVRQAPETGRSGDFSIRSSFSNAQWGPPIGGERNCRLAAGVTGT